MKVKSSISTVVTLFGLFTQQVYSGTLDSLSQTAEKPTVYILEDIHGDALTQKSHLEQILQLTQKRGLKFVATEGSWGYLSTAPLEFGLDSKSEKMASVQTLLNNKKLNAAHILKAVSHDFYTVFGIENKQAYQNHLQLKEKILKQRSQAVKELDNIIQELQASKTAEFLLKWKKLFSLEANSVLAKEFVEENLHQILSSLNLTADKKETLFDYAQLIQDYYRLALKRDLFMAQNTLDRIQLEKCKSLALIIGGFHTEGIKEYLIENGVRVEVLSPKKI